MVFKGKTIKSKLSASRARKCLSKQHNNILLKEFEINCLPRKEKIRELSLITNLNYVTIKTWFRNMRYKLRSYSSKPAKGDKTGQIYSKPKFNSEEANKM